MKIYLTPLASLLILYNAAALAQDLNGLHSKLPSAMDDRGAPLSDTLTDTRKFQSDHTGELDNLPTARLSNGVRERVSELTGWTRSAKGAQIYRVTSPSVVLIQTKDGLG